MAGERKPRFEWDEHNLGHLARHRITEEEVEELFAGDVVYVSGRTDAPDRFAVMGRTDSGRYLFIIYQQKANGVVRPFTGRDLRPHERRVYERQIGG